MAEPNDKQSNGVSIQSDEGTHVGGDVVGRDKITNIYSSSEQPPSTPGPEEFQSERRRVYEELWAMLENVHIRVRTDSIGKREFNELVRDVNAFILKNSLYIEQAHGALAAQYVKDVFKLSELVAQSRDKRARSSWHATDALPSDTLDEHAELRTMWNTVAESRDELVSQFRKVLQAKDDT